MHQLTCPLEPRTLTNRSFRSVATLGFLTFVTLGCSARKSTPEPTHVAPSNAHPSPESAACTHARAAGSTGLIDDFEADPARIRRVEERGGWWFSFDDHSGGQLIRERVALEPGDGSGHALHFVAAGFKKWGGGFGFTLHPATTYTRSCPYDASAYVGIQFRIRGRGRVRVGVGDPTHTPQAQGGTCTGSDAECYDAPSVSIALDSAWQNLELPFCSFLKSGGSAKSGGLDATRLLRVVFNASQREDVELWLDDVTFYRADAAHGTVRCEAACPLQAAPRSAKVEPRVTTTPSTPGLSLHTFEQSTASCGSLTRRYLSYVPKDLSPRSTAPVLVMLHGRGANAESSRQFLTGSRFEALADREHFIVIYGNAAPGVDSSADPLFPNSGSFRQGLATDAQVDDVDYLERLLVDLKSRDVVRGDNAVFLVGISNGGGMVLEAARRGLRQVHGIAAFMPFDGITPRSVPDLSASSLKRVLYAYSVGDPALSESYHEVLAQQPAIWASAIGIPKARIDSPRKSLLPNTVEEGADYRGSDPVRLATRNSSVTVFDIEDAAGDHRVRVLRLEHAGHLWPNPLQFSQAWALDQFGFRNQDFNAADLTWEFFKGA